MKDIRFAFVSILANDPAVGALCSGRIYPVRMQQNIRDPSLVYLRITDSADYHLGGDAGLQSTWMQLDALAVHQDSCVNLADAAQAALSGFAGRVVYDAGSSPPGFIDVRGIFQTNGRDLFDDTTQMFRMSRDYQIRFAAF